MIAENKKREYLVPALVVAIMIYGILAIRSAVAGDTHHVGYPFRQFVWDILALIFMLLTLKLGRNILRDIAIVLYILSIILLVFVLVKGVSVGGSRRWIDLGPVSFQPSEIAKLSLVVLLPIFLSKPTFKNVLMSLLLTIFPMMLVAYEPDLGTTILLGFIWLSVFIASRISLKWILVIVIITALMIPVFYVFGLKGYQKRRIEAFLNPEKYSRSAAYNVLQSIHAIGSGGLFGKGYMKGTANLLDFVPVEYSDFIIAVIGEELGFVGVLTLITLYSLLLFRFEHIYSHVEDEYWKLVIIGVGSTFFFHVAENLLMCVGWAPVTGIPLPFVSYGGSSALVFGIMVGLVMKAYAVSQIGREVKEWTRWAGSSNSSG